MKDYENDDSNDSMLGTNDGCIFAAKTQMQDEDTNEDFRNDIMCFQNENEINLYKSIASRKKKKKKEKKTASAQNSSNRKIVNMPASQPYVRVVDGEERLCFKYNTKVSESAMNAMPRSELGDNEFCVAFDLDTVDISKISEKFKADNVIYPRANVSKENYGGNRWIYETDCNKMAWKFVTLNPVLLYAKKGLIQRAVDSLRKYKKLSSNRRVAKDDIFGDGMAKRRRADGMFNVVTLLWTTKGVSKKCRIRIDIENVNLDKIEAEFKSKYSVYDDDFDAESFGLGRWECKNLNNEIAVKIAHVNVENTGFWNAVKNSDKVFMLKKAVEAYKNKDIVNYQDSSDDVDEIGAVVEEAIGNISQNEDIDDLFFFDESKEEL